MYLVFGVYGRASFLKGRLNEHSILGPEIWSVYNGCITSGFHVVDYLGYLLDEFKYGFFL